jgi:hypothetical protein
MRNRLNFRPMTVFRETNSGRSPRHLVRSQSFGLKTFATASAILPQYFSRGPFFCSIWTPFAPPAVNRLTMFRSSSPPKWSPGSVMCTVKSKPTLSSMAHLISSFKVSGAHPPTRMSYGMSVSSNPWKATAYRKPREMTELRRGKLASWISVEVMCQWAKAPLGCQPLQPPRADSLPR